MVTKAVLCSVSFMAGMGIYHYLIQHTSWFLPKYALGDDDDSECDEEEDELRYEPHKMILVVRMDLKMGKGKIAAQCSHATLGAYRRSLRRKPSALKAWEMLGQAKVAVKVQTEQELDAIAETASAMGLVNYMVIDAGRTQIEPNSKTVLGIGPAPVQQIDQLTGHLKLL